MDRTVEHDPAAIAGPAPQRRLSRRDFFALTSAVACAGASGAVWAEPASAAQTPFAGYKGTLCLFSKPLPKMDWRRLAQAAKRVGFGGIDLTVRPEGHVRPERAAEDLPKAVAAIREEGLEVPMITTALTSAADPAARPILATAARLSIPFFKPGYYQYKLVDVRRELDAAGVEFRGLADLARQCGIQAGFHNHEEYIGAPVWDTAKILEPLDPAWAGFYFDPRHATAEGGVGGWKIATNLVTPRLKMVAVKDFRWEKTAKGWTDANCPLGEGMVNWKYFFGKLAGAGFHGPISLHLEYEVTGPSAEKEQNILQALERDLGFLKARLSEAYEKV
ncbi:MAG TPA: sugar phosphate isomerase/epimerase family protein [Terriglobia bacterium]|nr:sugar phosphate isomerase/epimerase family protein [Terriglobia bacterium]